VWKNKNNKPLKNGLYTIISKICRAKPPYQRKERGDEIKALVESHTAELKELNNYTRERDLETQEASIATVTAVESIHQLINQKLKMLD